MFQVSSFRFQVSGFLRFEYNFTAKHAKFFNKRGFEKTEKVRKALRKKLCELCVNISAFAVKKNLEP
ncbi:hypothetical protein HYN86_17740 [Flavobacterium fluviale]|uniref:Uncharacterized protein n=1 Tax=Flavobacterium fluviale TaxID=2249356 RepID=A0A344LWP6_9FLAO|nr:hypothetical protein HYN86_17740 [Flavobacterium fluviale]